MELREIGQLRARSVSWLFSGVGTPPKVARQSWHSIKGRKVGLAGVAPGKITGRCLREDVPSGGAVHPHGGVA